MTVSVVGNCSYLGTPAAYSRHAQSVKVYYPQKAEGHRPEVTKFLLSCFPFVKITFHLCSCSNVPLEGVETCVAPISTGTTKITFILIEIFIFELYIHCWLFLHLIHLWVLFVKVIFINYFMHICI